MEFGQKNEEPLAEFCSLTYLQLKNCINLCESKFWHKIKQAAKRKFWKTCHFEGQNYGILPKNDEPLTESCSLTYFQSKSCTNLCEYEF